MALFGAIAFIPLFVQGVMGATATQAGQVLTPLFMGWVVMSIASARLTVKLGYRLLAITDSGLMTIGFIGLSLVQADSPRSAVLVGRICSSDPAWGCRCCHCSSPCSMAWPRSHLGLATSLNQFSRSVGAAVGIAAMGALMTRQLAGVSIPGRGRGACGHGDHADWPGSPAICGRTASGIRRGHRCSPQPPWLRRCFCRRSIFHEAWRPRPASRCSPRK